MSGVSSFLNGLKESYSAWMDGDDYAKANEIIQNYSDVEALKEHPGWVILMGRLDNNLECLKHEMLAGDEPEDPVLAKIWRAERRAFARAIWLLKDHADIVAKEGMDALEYLQNMQYSLDESE